MSETDLETLRAALTASQARVEELSAALVAHQKVWKHAYDSKVAALKSHAEKAEAEANRLKESYHKMAKDYNERLAKRDAALAKAREELDTAWKLRGVLEESVAEAREQLEFARNYTGFEARACPLCRYKDGKFVSLCKMHEKIEGLESRLSAMEGVVEAMSQVIEAAETEPLNGEYAPDFLRLLWQHMDFTGGGPMADRLRAYADNLEQKRSEWLDKKALASLPAPESVPGEQVCKVCGQTWKTCSTDGCYEDHADAGDFKPVPRESGKEGK